jgi:hypothetical protein
VIDEVFADHYLDVVKAAALLRLPPTLTEGLARIPTEGPLARSSADPVEPARLATRSGAARAITSTRASFGGYLLACVIVLVTQGNRDRTAGC